MHYVSSSSICSSPVRSSEASAVRHQAEVLIEELRLPVHLWYPTMWRAMDALRTGDPSAEAFVEAFRVEGERWQYRDVRLVYAVQYLHLAVDTGHPLGGCPSWNRSLRRCPSDSPP